MTPFQEGLSRCRVGLSCASDSGAFGVVARLNALLVFPKCSYRGNPGNGGEREWEWERDRAEEEGAACDLYSRQHLSSKFGLISTWLNSYPGKESSRNWIMPHLTWTQPHPAGTMRDSVPHTVLARLFSPGNAMVKQVINAEFLILAH